MAEDKKSNTYVVFKSDLDTGFICSVYHVFSLSTGLGVEARE